MQSLLQDRKLVEVPVAVLNKPGGAGTLGLTYLNQHPGSGRHFLVTSPTLLTNHIMGKTTVTYRDLTPLAIIGTEHVVFTVRSDSPIKTAADLVSRLKQDPASVSFALATALGNHNHIAIAQVARGLKADLQKLRVVVFTGSGQVATSLLGGHVDVATSPASAVLSHAAGGTVRILAVSAERRQTGPLAHVPTWKELGIAAVSGNVRNVVGPAGMNSAQVQYWDGVFEKLTAQEEWKQEAERNTLENTYMNAAQTRAAMDAMHAELTVILKELGLAK
jgi:putative tricarboxylic transport membrane protein